MCARLTYFQDTYSTSIAACISFPKPSVGGDNIGCFSLGDRIERTSAKALARASVFLLLGFKQSIESGFLCLSFLAIVSLVPSAVKVKDFCISSLFPHLLKERIKPVPSPYQKIKRKSPLLQEEFFISLFRSNARARKQYEQIRKTIS